MRTKKSGKTRVRWLEYVAQNEEKEAKGNLYRGMMISYKTRFLENRKA
jgi:hypothetical protein